MSDINDVYAWVDGSKLNVAMSISPVDVESRTFSPDVQYVFHVHSKRGLGVGETGIGSETRILCSFQTNTDGQCWVLQGTTTRDHVSGDPSNPEGITSKSGKVRLFAGRRSDPAFFNLQGFRGTVSAMKQRLGELPPVMFDAGGCPDGLTTPEVTTMAARLSAQITGEPPCSLTSRDCFAELNVRVILVQLDKSLVLSGSNTAVGVWASTHQAP